ncbi:hypothetical protein [Streptomyces canus]|uniref:hypothetical protein n=1 Tax=Streptomyces canus TaxID=58343 RepID=UPI002780E948|nr:hypothetical protein [Streptomyces canus]
MDSAPGPDSASGRHSGSWTAPESGEFGAVEEAGDVGVGARCGAGVSGRALVVDAQGRGDLLGPEVGGRVGAQEMAAGGEGAE